jgi:putative phosphoesterase
MRIVVIADTHVSKLEYLPKKIVAVLSTVNLIIHAGYFTDLRLLTELRQLREVKAVHGNMDSRELKTVLPAKEVVVIENKRIGVTHGSGAPWGIEERVRRVFESNPIEIIIYGHSHRSQNKVINGILFFNPGKATDSFGILTIDRGIKAEIASSR